MKGPGRYSGGVLILAGECCKREKVTGKSNWNRSPRTKAVSYRTSKQMTLSNTASVRLWQK